MLNEHPKIESRTSRIRVANFVGAAFAVELFAYVATGDWAEFTAIRQDVLLRIAEIVAASGARLAAPTRLTYLAQDAASDEEKSDAIVRRVTELRASDEFRLLDDARTGTE
jgi:MscS family membrane protein